MNKQEYIDNDSIEDLKNKFDKVRKHMKKVNNIDINNVKKIQDENKLKSNEKIPDIVSSQSIPKLHPYKINKYTMDKQFRLHKIDNETDLPSDMYYNILFRPPLTPWEDLKLDRCSIPLELCPVLRPRIPPNPSV